MPGLPSIFGGGKGKARRTYPFNKDGSDGHKDLKFLLGGKGANLCEMARHHLNVPPGFVITTDECQEFVRGGGEDLPPGLWEEVLDSLRVTEKAFGANFADPEDPLLVSVRSGAAVSMPGMMDTVLCLGLNEGNLAGLAKKGGERFALDCYRRFLDMYGDVVLGIPHSEFEEELAVVKAARGLQYDVEMGAEDLREVVRRFKEVYARAGRAVPCDPHDQLRTSIVAVFKSWNTPRAVKYREINRISKDIKGTAVNIQAMVFGNLGDTSATGVCFTRDPATGAKGLFGEFLPNAQGEDVVAGIRTPLPVAEMEKDFPQAFADLVASVTLLETRVFRDMQDCEFTVQEGTLFMLQTRNGKRTGQAALRIAVEMARDEGLVSKEEAVLMVEPRHLVQLLHPNFAGQGTKEYQDAVIGHGLPASPGAGTGRVVFTAEDAEAWRREGERVILLRMETSPEDVGGMHSAEGILTARGGMTSHAAVVARGWGKPCICGCDALQVDAAAKAARFNGVSISEGDWISVNGGTGEVLRGKVPTKPPELAGDLEEFMSWADAHRELGVLANADTPADAAVARKNGAQGIGLVRTEHMYFSSAERIAAMRRMIAAEELQMGEATEALEALKNYQREDFEGIFEAMDGLPVTVRLLDPPLHEFLPAEDKGRDELSKQLVEHYHAKPGEHMMGLKVLRRKLQSLDEVNPMMGLRGCRLGIVHPDIVAMQTKAVLEAALNVSRRGIKVHPHIMIPLVGFEKELQHQKEVILRAAAEVLGEGAGQKGGAGVNSFEFKVGTMIEIPRAALCAGELARHAEFFSVGSNDLTQMALGFSRDDAEARFLPAYLKLGILPVDPFEQLDEGVLELIRLAVERGRAARPDLSIGICGEHGGNPASIASLSALGGLDYVSCSPLRVPVARLAAAQAAIQRRRADKGGNDHCQD